MSEITDLKSLNPRFMLDPFYIYLDGEEVCILFHNDSMQYISNIFQKIFPLCNQNLI